jgi:ABC-type anion transport system duplicated permease subunit
LFISLGVSVILFFAAIQVVVAAADAAKHCSGTGGCLSAQLDAGNAPVFALAGFAFAVVAAGFAATTWRRRPDGAEMRAPNRASRSVPQPAPMPSQPPGGQYR